MRLRSKYCGGCRYWHEGNDADGEPQCLMPVATNDCPPDEDRLMRRVVIESPFAGKVEENLLYLRRCLADCFSRNEAPFASHGLYTQMGVLDDLDPEQRALGIAAGFLWGQAAEARVFYVDKGVTDGMLKGWREAKRLDQRVEVRGLLDGRASAWGRVHEARAALERGELWTP